MSFQIRPLVSLIKNATNSIVVSITLIGCVVYYQGRFVEEYFPLLVLTFLLSSQLMEGVDLESNNKIFWKRSAVSLITRWFFIVNILLLIGFASKITTFFSREVIFTWFVMTPIALVLTHDILRRVLNHVPIKKTEYRKAVIIGLNDMSIKLIKELKTNAIFAIDCVGYFDDRVESRGTGENIMDCPLLGHLNEITDFVKANDISYIYIALPMTPQPRVLSLLEDLRDTTASIYFVPDIFLFDLIQANISSINGIPLIAVCETPFVGADGIVKRISDVVLSLLILMMLSPILVIIAVAVKLTSRGPILFKQRRYGLDGKKIIVYKFRSMTVTEDGKKIIQATRNDARITPLGSFLRKTSLDELPQFINVLQGRMSIVGPRPHAVAHNEMYRGLIKGYMIRHKVKPGITGWAQVNGYRGETDTIDKMQKRVEYDLDYLRNWSLILDLLIIFRTVGVVFKDKNAY